MEDANMDAAAYDPIVIGSEPFSRCSVFNTQ
jgi:hypothetical protein